MPATKCPAASLLTPAYTGARSLRMIQECVSLLLAMPWEDRKIMDPQQPDMLAQQKVGHSLPLFPRRQCPASC